MAAKFSAIVPKKPPAGSPLGGMEKALQGWSGRVRKKLATYPPQRSSTYARTGTLGRGWTGSYRREAGSLVATVENAVPYVRFVQGDGDGAGQVRSAAASGWPTLQDVAMKEWPAALGAIEKAIADSIND